MATIKIVVRQRPNQDGNLPLYLRITKDRKSSFISLEHQVSPKDWDPKKETVRKSHPNSVRLNNILLKKKVEANDSLLDLEARNSSTTSHIIKKQIKPQQSGFFGQAKLFTDNLRKNGKYNRYTTDIGRIDKFKEFLNRDEITFPELTVNLLNQFRAWLKSTRDVKERTIVNYLLLIRTIYNQAAKSGVTDKKNYPFGQDKIALKFPDSIKISWNEEEVKKLENVQLSGYDDHARNVWLISFYFAGMRLSDVLLLRWGNFKDNRLQYGMSKNLKVDSLKIPDKVNAILDKYRNDQPKHDFVFPELKVLGELDEYEVKKKISFASKRIGKSLKKTAKTLEVNKNISPHISRHSFGGIAGDKISVQVLQMLYRHSNISTTIAYQGNFVHDKTDSALDAVLDF